MFGTPLWIELISLQEFEATRGLSITPVAQDPSSSPHATSPGSASACGVAGEGSKQQSLPSAARSQGPAKALGTPLPPRLPFLANVLPTVCLGDMGGWMVTYPEGAILPLM